MPGNEHATEHSCCFFNERQPCVCGASDSLTLRYRREWKNIGDKFSFDRAGEEIVKLGQKTVLHPDPGGTL